MLRGAFYRTVQKLDASLTCIENCAPSLFSMILNGFGLFGDMAKELQSAVVAVVSVMQLHLRKVAVVEAISSRLGTHLVFIRDSSRSTKSAL